jgi:hypothetical protein
MADEDAPFASELEALIAEPRRRLVGEARRPQTPIRERLIPVGLRLLQLAIHGTLPPNLVLTVVTEKTPDIVVKTAARNLTLPGNATLASLVLSTSSATVSFSPGIVFTPGLSLDAALEQLSYTYGSEEPTIQLTDFGIGSENLEKIRNELKSVLDQALQGSPMRRGGYDPTRDPHFAATLGTFVGGLEGAGEGGSSSALVQQMQLTKVSVDAVLLQGFVRSSEGGSLTVAPGSRISVSATIRARLTDVLSAAETKNPQQVVDSIALDFIELTIPMRLAVDGKDVARINSLRIEQSGKTTVTDLSLLGEAKSVDQLEVSLVAVFGFIAFLVTQERGVAGSDFGRSRALKNTARLLEARPQMSSDEIRRRLEPLLSAAITQFIRENLRIVPGLDLSGLFRVGS